MANEYVDFNFLGDHLRDEHGCAGEFAHLIPWSLKERQLKHDLDHDEDHELGHVHPDPKDLTMMEGQ